MQVARAVFRCGLLLLLLASAAFAADQVVLVSSQSAQGANDSASWAGAGKDGTVLGTTASLSSAVFSLTSCAAVCADFAVYTVYLNEAVMDFALSATTAGAVNPGQSAQYTVTVTPAAGFDQKVSLTCTDIPATTTCSISPQS